MIYQLTLQDVTYQVYSIQYSVTGSSIGEEMETSEILDNLFSIWMRQKWLRAPFFYRSLFPLLEIDLSSVRPHFEIKNVTSLIDEPVGETIFGHMSEEDIVMEMVEHDFIVRMPPKKRYTIQVEVKNIKKGELRIVEPEEFLITDLGKEV